MKRQILQELLKEVRGDHAKTRLMSLKTRDMHLSDATPGATPGQDPEDSSEDPMERMREVGRKDPMQAHEMRDQSDSPAPDSDPGDDPVNADDVDPMARKRSALKRMLAKHSEPARF